jgi:large subunit ribosomal protein L21
MYAVIEDSGTQFKVTSGDVINIDRAQPADGQEWPKDITFDRVLLVGGNGSTRIGNPLVGGATVKAEVLGPSKGKKLRVTKYNRRKGYHIERGHRQHYLKVKITAINI